eukprot:364283-Chlamydomonas_euryale.AAC.4
MRARLEALPFMLLLTYSQSLKCASFMGMVFKHVAYYFSVGAFLRACAPYGASEGALPTPCSGVDSHTILPTECTAECTAPRAFSEHTALLAHVVCTSLFCCAGASTWMGAGLRVHAPQLNCKGA